MDRKLRTFLAFQTEPSVKKNLFLLIFLTLLTLSFEPT